MNEKERVRRAIELSLSNIRVVGWGLIGCSECPFSEELSEINTSDPDEGYYNCSLIGEQWIWGECPECSDEDWIQYVKSHMAVLAEDQSLIPNPYPVDFGAGNRSARVAYNLAQQDMADWRRVI